MLLHSVVQALLYRLVLQAAAAAPLPADLQEIVTAHRKAIVLLEAEASAGPARERVAIIGRIIFQENHERTTRLVERLAAEITGAVAREWKTPPASSLALLEAIESSPELRDADKLVFRDTLAHLEEVCRKHPSRGAAARVFQLRLGADRRALATIEAQYGKELSGLEAEPRPPAARRPSWESYLIYLRMRLEPEAILVEYSEAYRTIEELRSARGAPPESDLETSGTLFPLRTVLLTFDDGPHALYTDRILATLREHGVKAVFFEVGERIGQVTAGGEIRKSDGAAISARVLGAGMALGNHTFTHPLLPRLDDARIADEIEKTSRLLEAVSGAPPVLFRAPYGAVGEQVLSAVEARHMKSVLWNVDSKDWADPVAASIADRVIRGVLAEGCGIVLFHDIHEKTTEALPVVVEVLQAAGFHFLAWNGAEFAIGLPDSHRPQIR